MLSLNFSLLTPPLQAVEELLQTLDLEKEAVAVGHSQVSDDPAKDTDTHAPYRSSAPNSCLTQ